MNLAKVLVTSIFLAVLLFAGCATNKDIPETVKESSETVRETKGERVFSGTFEGKSDHQTGRPHPQHHPQRGKKDNPDQPANFPG